MNKLFEFTTEHTNNHTHTSFTIASKNVHYSNDMQELLKIHVGDCRIFQARGTGASAVHHQHCGSGFAVGEQLGAGTVYAFYWVLGAGRKQNGGRNQQLFHNVQR